MHHEEALRVGTGGFLAVDSPAGRYSAFFEEADDTAYFYAVDFALGNRGIVDAVHIYDIAKVIDRDKPSTLAIVWSGDGNRCALLINGYPHAAFDFVSKRGYCRTNYPNFPKRGPHEWSSADHSWSDDAVKWLRS